MTDTRPPGRLIGRIEPGSPEWLTRMSASKIAAAVGLSSWESPFSLWHRMAGNIAPEPDSDEFRRGHYLEPAIIRWFGDQHPGWDVATPCGTYVHPERDWQTATPDAIVSRYGELSLLEVKTDAGGEPWGDAGTDEIPVYYRAQVMWQMDVMGINTCHVGLLTSYLEFREYVVEYDATEAQQLREAGWEFLLSVREGREPDLDASVHTYQALRQLHPSINGEDVDLPADLAREFCEARTNLKDAKARDTAATNRVAAHMGDARRARFLDHTIATRQARGDGTPYLVAGRRLPDFTEDAAA